MSGEGRIPQGRTPQLVSNSRVISLDRLINALG